MIDNFLFIGLPYIAIAVCILVTIYRLKVQSFSQSALSSQFLESGQLLWGSLPWHIGIGIVLLLHVFALFFPGLWASLMAEPVVLYTVEGAGIALGILAIAGLSVLIVRRMTSARLQSVTSVMDLAILSVLLVQVALGVLTATHYKWGASWATATAVPYVWGLLTFHPDISYVSGYPAVIKGHIIGAWLLILMFPFSRLVHIISLPLQYIFRPPQKVVWTTKKRGEAQPDMGKHEEARRYFLKGTVGVVAGVGLLGVGAADKLLRFFFGPRLSEKESNKLMATRVKRLEQTVEQKKYELERQQNDFIFISKLSDLSPTEGKYFIDYKMSPAMAFLDTGGLPLLISAKCTHLGCTVGNQVDKEGKILCPCHISYFDIHSGQPNEGSPAKAPLPHIGWVIMDQDGKMVARKSAAGDVKGKPDLGQKDQYSVFIARCQEEEA